MGLVVVVVAVRGRWMVVKDGRAAHGIGHAGVGREVGLNGASIKRRLQDW